nr:hypothetical protein JVH1_0253 [Rhodococcus sp. JVH1]
MLSLPVVGVSLSWRCSRVLLWGAGGVLSASEEVGGRHEFSDSMSGISC